MGRLLLLALGTVVGWQLVRELPALRRYWKMERM